MARGRIRRQRVRRPAHRPADARFFPDPYDGSEDSVRVLLERVCGYMDAIPDLVDLEFLTNPGNGDFQLVNDSGHAIPTAAAGTFEEVDGRFIIRLDRRSLGDAMDLVGTMAHELAHSRLLGENRIWHEAFDNEILTDLTVVHFGLGTFLANSPRNWEGQYTYWPKTELRKPEYMTPPMFGWALAHLAWFRGEEKPEWTKHLNNSARANLKQGIRYLFATGDSEYKPVKLR